MLFLYSYQCDNFIVRASIMSLRDKEIFINRTLYNLTKADDKMRIYFTQMKLQ